VRAGPGRILFRIACKVLPRPSLREKVNSGAGYLPTAVGQEPAMSEQEKKLDGPDFAQGVALADIDEGGMILGHVAGDAVLLARRGHELFAIGAECTHYH